MDKRYQVFVSSTYEDLREERATVIQALLQQDCFPAGMELFPAADEEQWSFIQGIIDECDYYILIVAGRYGSRAPDGMSFTEKEYRYALSKGKPILAFLHREPGKISAEKSEPTDEGKRRLQEFRTLVGQRLCKFWATPHELGLELGNSLNVLKRKRPATGWVRADELLANGAAEVLKLRRKVEELQSELQNVRTTAPEGTEGLARGEEFFSVSATAQVRTRYDEETFSFKLEATWNALFGAIAPLMLNEAPDYRLKSALEDWFKGQMVLAMRQRTSDPDAVLLCHAIDASDYHTIVLQFRALGLIVQNSGRRAPKDTATYWRLTPYGDSVMTKLLAVRRSQP